MKWSKDSWKNFEAKQMPTYSDQGNLDEVLDNLSSLPPLIFAGETRSLKSQIYQVQKGKTVPERHLFRKHLLFFMFQ